MGSISIEHTDINIPGMQCKYKCLANAFCVYVYVFGRPLVDSVCVLPGDRTHEISAATQLKKHILSRTINYVTKIPIDHSSKFIVVDII